MEVANVMLIGYGFGLLVTWAGAMLGLRTRSQTLWDLLTSRDEVWVKLDADADSRDVALQVVLLEFVDLALVSEVGPFERDGEAFAGEAQVLGSVTVPGLPCGPSRTRPAISPTATSGGSRSPARWRRSRSCSSSMSRPRG